MRYPIAELFHTQSLAPARLSPSVLSPYTVSQGHPPVSPLPVSVPEPCLISDPLCQQPYSFQPPLPQASSLQCLH